MMTIIIAKYDDDHNPNRGQLLIIITKYDNNNSNATNIIIIIIRLSIIFPIDESKKSSLSVTIERCSKNSNN